MNRAEIRLLQENRKYPSVSILLPTGRSHPEAMQDKLRLDVLVRQVTEELTRRMPDRDLSHLFNNLSNVVKELNFRENIGDGLAIFANENFCKKFVLPFSVKERVVISESFALRELVESSERMLRFRLLVLTEPRIRLLNGSNDSLVEANLDDFPMEHVVQERPEEKQTSSAIPGSGEWFGGPFGQKPMPGNYSPDISGYREEHMRIFFRKADEALTRLMNGENIPLIIAGTQKNVALFKEISQNSRRIAGVVPGSYDKTWQDELLTPALELIEQFEQEQNKAAMQELQDSVSGNLYATGVREVWQTAKDGRCKTVFVERGYFCPATVQADGNQIEPLDKLEDFSPSIIPDVVDDVIGTVLSDSGQVCFVEDGALEQFGRIAAILRY